MLAPHAVSVRREAHLMLSHRAHTKRLGLCAVLGVVTVAVSSLIGVTSASAVRNGVDPRTTPLLEPVSQRPVSEWRFSGWGQGVSATQVAPQWILASKHAGFGSGISFTNANGSAVVDGYYPSPTSDISLSHLATPIASKVPFPDLVEDTPGSVLSSGGNVLSIGIGGGSQSATWTNANNTATLAQVTSNAIPMPVPGDSGGSQFFYGPGSTTGHLIAVTGYAVAGVINGGVRLNADVRTFIDGVVGPSALQWTTTKDLSGLGARPSGVVPTIVAPATKAGSGSAISLSWTTESITPPITRYRAAVFATGTTTPFRVVETTANSVTIDGLAAGTSYTSVVLPSNEIGESGVPGRMTSTAAFVPGFVVAGATIVPVASAAGPLQSLTVSQQDAHTIKAVVVRAANTVPGSAFTTYVLKRPDGTLLTTASSFQTRIALTVPDGVRYGDPLQLTATDSTTAGSSTPVTVDVTFLPPDVPLPPASGTVTTTTDGTITISATVQSDAAIVASLTDNIVGFHPVQGYQPHADAKYVVVEAYKPGDEFATSSWYLDPRQPTITFNAEAYGLLPAAYRFVFNAYDFTFTDVSAPLVVNATIGGPPGAVEATSPSVAAPGVITLPNPYDDWDYIYTNFSQPAPATSEVAPTRYITVWRSPVWSGSDDILRVDDTDRAQLMTPGLPLDAAPELWAVNQSTGAVKATINPWVAGT